MSGAQVDLERQARLAQTLAHEHLGFGIGALVALHGLFDCGTATHEFGLACRKPLCIQGVYQAFLGAFFGG